MNKIYPKFVFKKFKKTYDTKSERKFLKLIEDSPVLTWQKERELIKLYKNPSCPEEKEKALKDIIMGNIQILSIAVMMAVKYLRNDEFMQHLHDIIIDFIAVIDEYDLSRVQNGQLRLWGFAGHILKKRIQDHNLKSKKILHGATPDYLLSKKIAREELAIGKDLSIQEIVTKYKCDVQKARRAKRWILSYVSVSNIMDKTAKHQESLEVTLTHNRIDESVKVLSPYEILERKDQLKYLKTLIKPLLSEKEYTVIYLHYFKGYSFKKIETLTNLKNKDIDNAISRGIKKLRENVDLKILWEK